MHSIRPGIYQLIRQHGATRLQYGLENVFYRARLRLHPNNQTSFEIPMYGNKTWEREKHWE